MNVETESLIQSFPNPLDQQLLELECKNDPAFEAELAELLQETGGMQSVIDAAKKAIVNDIDPTQYPEMEGSWPMLRNVARDIYDAITAVPTPTQPRSYGTPLSGLGQDLSGILTAVAPLLGTLASAGASVYAAKQQQEAQQYIAQQQLNANMAEIKAQEAMAAAQTAIANNQTTQAVSSVLPPVIAQPVAGAINALTAPVTTGSGIQIWELLLGGYLFMKYAA